MKSKFSLLKELKEYSYLNKELSVVEEMLDFYHREGNPFSRNCLAGHFTGSAFIVDPELDKVLLCHHRKINKWLQPGGHADGNSDLLEVAKQEVLEECGLYINSIDKKIFDLDIHHIPTFKNIFAHKHYDVRFLFEVDSNRPIKCSEESNDLRWISFDQIDSYTQEYSIQRMLNKVIAG